MSQYAALDAAIIARITEGPTRFYILELNPTIAAEAHRLSELTCREHFRIIDGRLAALRKAGKIKVDRKTGWSLAAPVAADQEGQP